MKNTIEVKNDIIKVLTEDVSLSKGMSIAKQDQFRVPCMLDAMTCPKK